MTPVTQPHNRLSRIKTWLFEHATPRALRFVYILAATALTGFALILLLLRFVLLPQIDNYRADLERELSAAIHLPVSIGSIEGRMQGIRPRLELRNLSIKDDSGRPALSFDNVTGVLGWASLLRMAPHFYLLEVTSPVLAIRRDAAGHLFVAGLPVKTDPSGPDISAWVLDQHAVVIRDARVTWSDELRQAPPLTLEHLNLQLERTVVGHRFGLTAEPPAALSAKVDLRGAFNGDSINELAQWEGELYGEVAHADLAGWKPWIDYPLELPRGSGGLRAWIDFAALRPTAITADVSLADVQIRLAPQLQMLSLQQLNGRVAAVRTKTGFELTTRQLSLATTDGVKVAPTDLHVERNDAGGEFSANTLDFRSLAALAAHLPLPDSVRQQLAAYAPQGSLEQFRLRWRGPQWPFARYSIKGSFSKIAFASIAHQPGFSGLSGTIDGDQDGGTLNLAGRGASVTLPTVFHQPLPFDVLDAHVRWKQRNSHTELELTQVQFRNADAEGVASGSYQFSDKGAGNIDLDARLSRADGAAVWRYIPLQAGADVGPFLHAGLTRGRVSEATLKLKGNLDKFPFADRSGTFRIHGAFHDAVLRYAEGWPQIEGITGVIDFDGPAMTISTSKGQIMGVNISSAKAVIPDLETLDEQVLVEGKAAGATASFLRFIEASPVGAQIDHFTEDMTASGNGELNIKLVLPLRRINQSQIQGTYRFDGNRLLLDPDMPALDDVRGSLDFSADKLTAKGLTGSMFGLPLKLDLGTQTDGSVLAEVSGDASAAQLRKQFAYAGLKNLSGTAHWTGTVRARKKSAEVRIASDLVGLSSSLPEPFNKTAREAMPLLIERKPVDMRLLGKKIKDRAARESTELSIGRTLRAQLIHRDDNGHSSFERGLVTLGDIAVRLPERGLTVAVVQPRINLDLWRSLLADGSDKPAAAKAALGVATSMATKAGSGVAPKPAPASANNLMPNRIDLRTAELLAMGRTFHDVRLAASRPSDTWTADITSKELAAKLEWLDADTPKLSGRISRFALPESAVSSVVSPESLKTLPNLDLTLDHLALNGHDYGELHITAENKGNDWNSNFTVKSDDAVLEGQGRWRLQPPVQPVAGAGAAGVTVSDTQLDFKLNTRSIEHFLNRIGYPNTVKRGRADLNGRLSWKGAPHEFDLALLNGQLSLDARDGQFNKLEPGVGRLLGILSLQSVTRRITLDFRDVFSEGFAFDSLKGQMTVSNGVMSTQNMEIRGPAAKVQMAGNIDLNQETQDLKVRVQPMLGESVATGALFIHPAVGATAWVFNKLFGNPLDSAFAYDFAVTGGWAEPKVDKIATQPGAAAKPDAAGAGK